MDPSLIVGVIGIFVAVATFYLGRRYERRLREQDKSDERVDRFVNNYVDRARRHIDTGIPALTPAGIFRLNNDREIRNALEICARQLGKHPLGKYAEVLATVDLKLFFDCVSTNKINFATTSVEEALRQMGK